MTAASTPDTLTVLTVRRGVMAKRHTWSGTAWKTSDEPEGAMFAWHEHVVSNVRELSSALVSLEQDSKSIVIRDVPVEGIESVVRRLGQTQDDGTLPSFERHADGRRWMMIDVDKAPVPPPDVATEPSEAAVRWAIETYLPAAFHGISVHYHWSGNAGVKPWDAGLRIHLWYWLSAPVCEEALRAWALATPYVDPTIYDRVHIHYTANPLFAGASDPVAARSGLLEGTHDQVDVEALVGDDGPILVDAASWCARQATRVELDSDSQAGYILQGLAPATNRRQAWAQKKLEESIREILSLPKGSRNDLIFRIALSVGRIVDAGGLDPTDTLRALEDAAVAVGDKAAKDRDVTRRAFARGQADPRDLSHIGTEPTRAPLPPTSPKQVVTDTKPAAPKVELADYFCTKDRRLTIDGRSIARDDAGRWQIGRQVVPGIKGVPQPDAAVPVGFYAAPWGIGAHTNGDKAVPIVPCPVFIAGRCYDVHARSYALLVTWRDPAGWHRRLVPREEAFSNRVQSLAKWGLPVTSESAKGLVRYLQAYEAENFRLIPTLRISRTMGWQDAGGESAPVDFLLGFKRITAETTLAIDVDKWTAGQWSDEVVAYRPMDAGDRQYAEAFVSRGNWSAWVEAVRIMAPYPKATIGIIASFASVMLEVLHASGFAIDWAAPAGTGKSTILRAAESVWGDPHEIRRMWDGSSTFYERSFATLHSLPLFVDDTKRATTKGNDDLVPEVIYMAENGRGRGRGNLVHTDETPRWRTLLFSTGEHPATGIGNHGGAKSRCIEVTGLPFKTQHQGALVTLLDQTFTNNYGMAGERFVKWLLEQRSRWGEWQDLFAALFRDYTQDIRSGAESRLAGARAVLEVTRRCVEEALDLRLGDPLPGIWSQVTAHATDADGSLRALEEIVAHFAASRESFLGCERGEGRQPNGGWLGIYRPGGADVVAFFPQTMDRFLKERGHQRSVLDVWRERQWTIVDTDHPSRVDKRVSMKGTGERPRCVCLRLSIINGTPDLGPGLVQEAITKT